MKKFCLFLSVLLMLSVGAQAEITITAPFASESAPAQIVAALSDILMIPYELSDDGVSATNEMLADASIVLCDTQDALIAGLQGYTDQDLRHEMIPLCRVASCPLFLVMNRANAAQYGIEDASTFLHYIKANEYEFLLARHITADPIDRAATKLSDELPILTDYFLPEEILEELQSDTVQVAILDGATLLAMEENDLLILCSLGDQRAAAYPDVPCAAEVEIPICQDIFIGLYVTRSSNPEIVWQFESLSTASELNALLLSLGYEFSPLSGADFELEIQATFADYKDYMTAEGLFFYEE